MIVLCYSFVGSETSNWCRLIREMERTRGDGGVEYYSVDKYNCDFHRTAVNSRNKRKAGKGRSHVPA